MLSLLCRQLCDRVPRVQQTWVMKTGCGIVEWVDVIVVVFEITIPSARRDRFNVFNDEIYLAFS